MLAIRYLNIFLDLDDQQSELQKNSPLFLNNQAMAEYSTPISIKYSDKNANLLGRLYFDYTVKTRRSIDVEIYDHGTFREAGTLVIESAGYHHLQTGKRNLVGYLLTGISSFYTNIQKKKLTELNLGGDRFLGLFTTWDPFDGSNGFWQKIHATWAFSEDYVFVPMRNDVFEYGIDSWQNKIQDGVTEIQFGSNTAVIPFIKLEYLLTRIFEDSGWTLDTTLIGDEDWKRLVLPAVKPLATIDALGIPLFEPFNLVNFVPQDKTCTEFLYAICNRYAWSPVFNVNQKTCKIIALKNILNSALEDWTEYADPIENIDFNSDPKAVAFKTVFEGEDELPSAPDLSGYTVETVASKADLPLPTGAYDQKLVFCFKENQWYKIVVPEGETDREWQLHGDNIFDSDIDNATETYETKCATLPVYWTQYRSYGGNNYYGLFAQWKQSQYKKFGIYTLFYHGLVNEVLADMETPGAKQYPFVSSVKTLPDGSSGTAWSNVYHHINAAGDDYGIVPFWFKPFVDLVNSVEEKELIIYLPLHKLITFKWETIKLIRNIPYLVKSITEPRPYKGFIRARLLRINIAGAQATAEAPAVYVKLVKSNYHTVASHTVPGAYFDIVFTNALLYDISYQVFSDAAGLIPLTVAHLVINERIVYGSSNGVFDSDTMSTLAIVANDSYEQFNEVETADTAQFTLPGDPGTPLGIAGTDYTHMVTLQPSPSYTIIP